MQFFWLDLMFLPPNRLPKPTLFPQMLKSVIDLSYLCTFTCPWRRNQVTNVKAKRASGELRNSSSAQICSKTIASNESAFGEVSATQTDLTLMKVSSIETVFFPVWVGVRKKKPDSDICSLFHLLWTSAVTSLTPHQAPPLSHLHTQALRATTSHTLSLLK